ncbi:hypothetical protein COY95_04825 [Candidatus Woesearchaeota archaeon CG_4_10_14_0_8_um_filter_47_5]|nr:MAG: hypothetical protein COY95_04825 [Candidatus Woesearchaeota archaeon CG_4_10_14_0_8_um_filter_47_5]
MKTKSGPGGIFNPMFSLGLLQTFLFEKKGMEFRTPGFLVKSQALLAKLSYRPTTGGKYVKKSY